MPDSPQQAAIDAEASPLPQQAPAPGGGSSRPRKAVLTASSFGQALGFWKDGRLALWKVKAGLVSRQPCSAAIQWGTMNEARVIRAYQDVTGNTIRRSCFRTYREEDDAQGWLGGTPDGVVVADALGLNEKAGIVEVKCPFNRGEPELCVPWPSVPYYYMPQVQGLMEILDLGWLDFFVWTVNGSMVFRVERDPAYWVSIFSVLSDFWWGNVVPAKVALLLDEHADVGRYMPSAQHGMTEDIEAQSRKLACKAKLMLKDEGCRKL